MFKVICRKSKKGNVYKALVYVNSKGWEKVLTFDRWTIADLVGWDAYKNLKEGEEICLSTPSES